MACLDIMPTIWYTNRLVPEGFALISTMTLIPISRKHRLSPKNMKKIYPGRLMFGQRETRMRSILFSFGSEMGVFVGARRTTCSGKIVIAMRRRVFHHVAVNSNRSTFFPRDILDRTEEVRREYREEQIKDFPVHPR